MLKLRGSSKFAVCLPLILSVFCLALSTIAATQDMSESDVTPAVYTQDEIDALNAETERNSNQITSRDILDNQVSDALESAKARSAHSNNYAGHYVDMDDRAHIFWATGKAADIKSALAPGCQLVSALEGQGIDVTITPVKYSLAELETMLERIDGFFMGHVPPPYGMMAYYKDIRENKIIMYISEPFSENVQAFKDNILDNDAIEFHLSIPEEALEEPDNTISLRNGIFTTQAMVTTTNASNSKADSGSVRGRNTWETLGYNLVDTLVGKEPFDGTVYDIFVCKIANIESELNIVITD